MALNKNQFRAVVADFSRGYDTLKKTLVHMFLKSSMFVYPTYMYLVYYIERVHFMKKIYNFLLLRKATFPCDNITSFFIDLYLWETRTFVTWNRDSTVPVYLYYFPFKDILSIRVLMQQYW